MQCEFFPSSYTLKSCIFFCEGVRDINNLTVQCNNVKSGCKWVGTLGDLDDHIMNKCGYTEVDCPYMQCSVYVKRRDLDSHKKKCSKRNYACKRCGEWMVYDMKQVHGSVCRKKSVKCRNIGCSLTTERDRMDEHEGKCKYAEAACRYEYIGCTVIRRRKEIKQHEQDDTIHLQLALEELQTVQAQLCRKEDELEAMHEKAMNLEGRLEIARKEIQKLKLESGHEPAHERRRQSGRLPLESRVQNSSKMQQRPTNPSSEGSSCTIS